MYVRVDDGHWHEWTADNILAKSDTSVLEGLVGHWLFKSDFNSDKYAWYDVSVVKRIVPADKAEPSAEELVDDNLQLVSGSLTVGRAMSNCGWTGDNLFIFVRLRQRAGELWQVRAAPGKRAAACHCKSSG